jgi:peptidoglycan/xylan/chitin deacetylase (PgdA/CDA1 family)
MKQSILFTVVVSIFLTACGAAVVAAPEPSASPSALPSPTRTATVTETATPTRTFTPSPSPAPTWVVQGPDDVIVPILLYHRIDVSPVDSRYYVPPEKFEQQIKLLHDWEYTVISVETLVRAIEKGARLPPRPVILTFDDGDLSVYTTAFPIMQRYGFTGVAYIVGNYMDTEGYMSAAQIRELAEAGWEIGSHSRSHQDLTRVEPAVQRLEVVESREFLEETLGVPVLSFAYPFGKMNNSVGSYAHFAGYIAGMGLGYTNDQGESNLFWLQRRDMRGEYDIKQFAAFLPWQGHPAFMPPDTPTPTPRPSRTPVPTYTQYPTRTTAP